MSDNLDTNKEDSTTESEVLETTLSKTSVSGFTIKTTVFEGPLDLLLTLIEKRKLFINDISLSKVTDEYVEYITRLGEYSLSDRTQFIYIASTLLLIKAKSLLPTLTLTEEEKTDIADLEHRLKELEIIRKSSLEIQKAFGTKLIFPRGDFKIDVKVFVPSADTSIANIQEAIGRVLTALPKKQTEPKVAIKKTISIEEMMVRLTDRIKSAVRMSFREFSGGKSLLDKGERVHVIVSFLAMLELVKQGTIDANQDGLFDEIHMETQQIGIPRY